MIVRSEVIKFTMHKPLVELFTKASIVDPGDKGACPFSQKWFMIFYLFVERKVINLRVIPVSSANPPTEYLSLDMGKQLPAVAFYTEASDDLDVSSVQPESIHAGNDELEQFFKEKFGSQMNIDVKEQWVGADLLRSLNHFLRTGSDQQMLANLNAINDHLLNTHTTFLEGNDVSYSDCVLSCKLHHVRVAASFFRGFTIPEDLQYVWSYLKAIYSTRVFEVSCPLDRDILLHYLEKVEFTSQEARNQAHHEIIILPQERKTTFVSSDDPEAANCVPRLRGSGVKLTVNSVMTAMEYDKSVGARLSKLYSMAQEQT
nr:chloride intracellular channel exc 4 [Hymenolepis microstoma]